MLVASDKGAPHVGTVLRRKRNFKAPQYSVPGNDIQFVLPPQKPTFNAGFKLMKPQCVVYQPRPTGVPLKSLQQYSHAEGASLFDAPIVLVPEPLKVVVPSTGTIDYASVIAEIQIPFQPEFEYSKGIRPGKRTLHVDAVDEPAAPFPTRPDEAPAPAKVQTGTFRVGNKDYDILGF